MGGEDVERAILSFFLEINNCCTDENGRHFSFFFFFGYLLLSFSRTKTKQSIILLKLFIRINVSPYTLFKDTGLERML